MGNSMTESDGLIEVVSVLGKSIRITQKYWDHIVQHKHPELNGRIRETLSALHDSNEVYQQEEGGDIHLYYRQHDHYTLCVVARHLNGDGFIVTAYLTTQAKRKGIMIWKKNTT